MAAYVQFRPQKRDLGVVVREMDEDLAISLGIRNGENQINNNHLLLENRDEFNDLTNPDDFLNSEVERIDYNRILAQHDTPLPVEKGLQDSISTQAEIPNGENISPESELLENTSEQTASVDTSNSLQLAKSTSVESCVALDNYSKKPLSSGSSKAVSSKTRSSAPAKALSRSSTPGGPSKPVSSKSGPPSATRTRKSVNPSISSNISSSDQSSSMIKRGTTTSSSGSSKPSKPSSTLMPRRPSSISRGRPCESSTLLSSSKGKPKQNSSSPVKARCGTNIAGSRGLTNEDNNVNPVLIGSKMVERVVNMRKLAPPRVEKLFRDNQRKSSREKLGFGRSLSKTSLDMAIRHMDIKRILPDNI